MPLRLGRVDYINTFPLEWALSRHLAENGIDEVVGVPTRLNELLAAGEVDAANVSSVAYARDAESYVLLPSLCVGSDGAVESVQLVTALWMWGRLPGAGTAPPWTAPLHRWSGSVAFVLTLPVALHCIWSLGFVTSSPRVVVHGLAGCAFYGAYAAKMLALRLPRLPGWVLPVLGGSVLSSLVLLWLSAALWFFTRTGVPLI